MGTKKLTVVVLLSGCMIAGCASIPQETPVLSEEIGQRISVIEAAHLGLLRRYFDLKRAEADRIFTREWIPEYLESFFSHPETRKYRERLSAKGDEAADSELLTELAPRLLEEIRSRRNEFMKPLDDLEKEMERNLRREYREVLSASNALTSFLVSSSKVTKNRERYVNMLGVEREKYLEYLDRADQVLEEIEERILEEN